MVRQTNTKWASILPNGSLKQFIVKHLPGARFDGSRLMMVQDGYQGGRVVPPVRPSGVANAAGNNKRDNGRAARNGVHSAAQVQGNKQARGHGADSFGKNAVRNAGAGGGGGGVGGGGSGSSANSHGGSAAVAAAASNRKRKKTPVRYSDLDSTARADLDRRICRYIESEINGDPRGANMAQLGTEVWKMTGQERFPGGLKAFISEHFPSTRFDHHRVWWIDAHGNRVPGTPGGGVPAASATRGSGKSSSKSGGSNKGAGASGTGTGGGTGSSGGSGIDTTVRDIRKYFRHIFVTRERKREVELKRVGRHVSHNATWVARIRKAGGLAFFVREFLGDEYAVKFKPNTQLRVVVYKHFDREFSGPLPSSSAVAAGTGGGNSAGGSANNRTHGGKKANQSNKTGAGARTGVSPTGGAQGSASVATEVPSSNGTGVGNEGNGAAVDGAESVAQASGDANGISNIGGSNEAQGDGEDDGGNGAATASAALPLTVEGGASNDGGGSRDAVANAGTNQASGSGVSEASASVVAW